MPYKILKENFDCPCCSFNDAVNVAVCESYTDLKNAFNDFNTSEGHKVRYVRIQKALVVEYHAANSKLEMINEQEKALRRASYGASTIAGLLFSALKGVKGSEIALAAQNKATNNRKEISLPRYKTHVVNVDGSITMDLNSNSEHSKNMINSCEFV